MSPLTASAPHRDAAAAPSAHSTGRRAPHAAAQRWAIVAVALAAFAVRCATPLGAQRPARDATSVSVAGNGAVTYVLLTGMVGGVAGFRRLEAQLLERGHRVVIVDAYRLSIDSADVTFAALARRVAAVLDAAGVDSARVDGHAHGAGVALRLAASQPRRVSALYFLDVGALADHRSPVFSSSLRLVPIIVRLPGGRHFVRGRFLRGLRQASGETTWLDAATERAYAEPMLDGLPRVVRMALRLAKADEPEPLADVLARVRVPVTMLLGDAPHTAGPVPAELTAIESLGALLHVEHLAGVGHFPHEEAPADLARRIAESYASPRAMARR